MIVFMLASVNFCPFIFGINAPASKLYQLKIFDKLFTSSNGLTLISSFLGETTVIYQPFFLV